MRARGVEGGGMESGGRSRTQDRAQPRLQHSPANSGPLLLAAQTTHLQTCTSDHCEYEHL